MNPRLSVAVATALGVGYVPFAPGTFGSLAGLVVFAAVRASGLPVVELAAIVVVFLIGAWAASAAETHFGHIDPGPVVIDEVLGMLVTLAFIPVGWPAALTGFLLFRVFDVIKPYPANRFERLHGGFGVMADDAMAAVYANVVLRGVVYLLPGWFA